MNIPVNGKPTADFDISAMLSKVLQEMFEVEPDDIVPEANLFEDLDLDSIDAVDLVLYLQEETGRKVSPEEFKEVRTVGDVITVVGNLLAEE